MTTKLTAEQQALEQYYLDVLETLNSPGWKHLTEDWENQRKTYSDIGNVSGADQLWFNKGVVNNIDYLLSLREQFEKGYEQNFGGSGDNKAQVVDPNATSL